MKIKASLLSGLVALTPFAFAQDVEVHTDPVGYVSKTIIPGDQFVSVPLNQSPTATLTPTGVSGDNVLVFEEGTVPELTGEHFVHIRRDRVEGKDGEQGPLDGLRLSVDSSNQDSVTLYSDELAGYNLEDAIGKLVDVIPEWTLSSLLKPEHTPNETQVLLFDADEVGVDRTVRTVTLQNGVWREGLAVQDDLVIVQGDSFIIRDSAESDWPLVIAGSVPMADHRINIKRLSSSAQDNSVGLTTPVNVQLGDAGLPEIDGLQLLSADPGEVGVDRPLRTFQFSGGQWREGLQNRDDFELEPGEGYFVRVPTGDADSWEWQHRPSFLDQ